MKAVILAAGLGTRLRPLTDETPKILLEVNGETLLARQVRYLHSQGVEAIAMNTHHLAKQVEDYCAVDSSLVGRVEIFHEPTLLGTAGALLPMREWLGNEPFILLYGDTLTDLALSALQLRIGEDAVLACSYSVDAKDKGIVQLDRLTDAVIGFVEKPTWRVRGVVFGGVALIRPRVLARIQPGDDFGHDLFPLLANQRRLAASTFAFARFHDVGTPEALATSW